MSKKKNTTLGRAWALPALEGPSNLTAMRLKHGMSIQALQGPSNLTAMRLKHGMSIQQISDRTKISIRYLQAIEAGEFSQLPAGIYGRSYIRQYADAIQCNAEQLLTMCPLEFAEERTEQESGRDGMMRARGGTLIARLVHLAARWRAQSSPQRG